MLVVGAANVGKSAFVKALLNDMSSMKSANYDIGAAQIRHKPVESGMPGTTLGIIPLKAFGSGGVLHDTPGLHLEHRLIHMMLPSEVRKVLPRKPLSPFVAKTPASILIEKKLDEQQGTGSNEEEEDFGLDYILDDPDEFRTASATYLWGDVARLDITSCPMSTHVVFCGINTMRVTASPLLLENDNSTNNEDEGNTSLSSASMKEEDSEPAGEGKKEELGKLKVPELKEKLRELGLPVSGRKAELVERLLESAEEAPEEEATAGVGVVVLQEVDEPEGLVSVKARGGLQPTKELVIQSPNYGSLQAVVDICVSGVPGWITLYAKASEDPIRAVVHTPRGIQVFLREPFPLHCIDEY